MTKKKVDIRKLKPFVVLYKSNPEVVKGLFIKEWKYFDRFKTREQALEHVASKLVISDLFLFKLKNEDKVYCRGY